MPRRTEPDPIAELVGARIRELRAERGLTQEALAYESDVGSKGYLSDIERGLAVPSLGTLAAICERLEVELVELFVWTDEGALHELIKLLCAASDAELKTITKQVRATLQR